MAKGDQRSNKETKKPKKDTGTSKPLAPSSTPGPSFAITTVVPERGKKKGK